MISRQKLEQIRDAIAQAMQAGVEEESKQDGQGKYTMILDSAANPSYHHDKVRIPTKLTKMRNIQTPNGKFLSNEAAMITLKKNQKEKTAEAIVHLMLPTNLLSTTLIVNDIGPIILDKKGTAVLTDGVYRKVKHTLDYLANRRKNLYEVPLDHSTICMSAQQDKDMMSTNGYDQPVAKVDETREVNTNRKTTEPLVQTRSKGTEVRFTLTTRAPNLEKKPLYKWHLILNHASQQGLKTMAKNPYLKHPELKQIKTSTDMSCRGCWERKLKRATHRRKKHNYETREAVSSDIMGPIHLPGMPGYLQCYFISFIECTTRYAYTHPMKSRAEAPKIITTFINSMQAQCQRTPRWLITDNAGNTRQPKQQNY